MVNQHSRRTYQNPFLTTDQYQKKKTFWIGFGQYTQADVRFGLFENLHIKYTSIIGPCLFLHIDNSISCCYYKNCLYNGLNQPNISSFYGLLLSNIGSRHSHINMWQLQCNQDKESRETFPLPIFNNFLSGVCVECRKD